MIGILYRTIPPECWLDNTMQCRCIAGKGSMAELLLHSQALLHCRLLLHVTFCYAYGLQLVMTINASGTSSVTDLLTEVYTDFA